MADKRLNSEQNSDSSDGTDNEVLHKKRTKLAGAATYKTKFNKDSVKKYPFISAVEKEPSSHRCNICCQILSCSHQGESDVKHIASSNHMKLVKVQSKQPTITSMFAGE